MKTNEEQFFDELMRQKLGDYSEAPDLSLLENIHAKKNRVLRLYGLYRMLTVMIIAGLTFIGSYMWLSQGSQPDFSAQQTIAGQASSGSALPRQYPASILNADNNVSFSTSTKDAVQSSTSLQAAGKTSASYSSAGSKTIHNANNFTKNITQGSTKTVRHLPVSNKEEIAAPPKTEKQQPADKDVKKENKDLSSCKALFDYYVSYDGKYVFSNFSETAEGSSIKWDLGDGTYSADMSPEHFYKVNGTYTVTLLIRSASCEASFQKTFNYSNGAQETRESVSIKGRITGNGGPIEKGKVQLLRFNKEQNAFTAYSFSQTTLSGEYTFGNLGEGRYLILADAGNNKFIPTYWGNSTEQSDAQEVRIMDNDRDDLTGYNIQLAYNRAMSGVEAGRTAQIDTNNSGPVIVFDQNNNMVTTLFPDHNGHLQVNSLPAGDYQLVDKQSGNSSRISIPGSPASSTGAYNGGGAPAVNPITLVPNPAVDHVKFDVNSTRNEMAEITIVNVSGGVVYHGFRECVEGENLLNVDISGLPPGIYYVIAQVGSRQVQSGQLIKRADESR